VLQVIDTARGKGLADEYGIRFLETSAKTGAGVEDAFNDLDLGPSFMPFSLDEDFLNSLMATHQHNSGASSNDNGPDA
jgi:hypothetical protein